MFPAATKSSSMATAASSSSILTTRPANATSRAGRLFVSCEPRPGELRDLPAVTRDKGAAPIQLLGNIEFPEEARHCLDRGAEGVGLYRTEFLYLNKVSDPTEAEHLEAYQTVLR